MNDVVFALPAGSDQVSGGNIYNDQLIRALGALVPVQRLDIEACRARVLRGEAGRYLIDSLDLRAFVTFPARRPGQTFTLVVHHLPSLEPDLDPGDEALRIEAAALARFDAFVATSPFTAAVLAARGHTAARIITLPPAPALALAAPADATTEPPPSARAYAPPLRALIVGNLIPRKSTAELLAALDARLAPGDPLVVEVIGRADVDPAYARRCLALIGGSPRLAAIARYRGALAPVEMPARYREADLLVSASRMETFGMALQEARAHGLPILALDGGYARHHFTDGDTGLLISAAQPRAIDALAGTLLALARDADRMRRLFERAQAQRPAPAPGGWPDLARRLLAHLAACEAAVADPI